MIRLVHPDKSVCAAMAASLVAVWPEIPLVSEGGVAFELTGPPRRLSVLIEQLRALIRPGLEITIGAAHLDVRMREWRTGGEVVILTEKEVAVLLHLWREQQAGRQAVTREELLRDVWQYASDTDTHTIETHIYRLRQKIEIDPANPEFLMTTKDGYRLR